MSHPIVQYHGVGIFKDKNGKEMPFTFFHDHFGDNFDDYIAQSYCHGPDEQPENTESIFRQLLKGDRQRKRHERFVTLKDLSSDGKVYVR